MGRSDSDNFTPLDDVVTVAAWVPDGAKKGGAMLYTFPYDVTTRPAGQQTSGTGYPDGRWTRTIDENLALTAAATAPGPFRGSRA